MALILACMLSGLVRVLFGEAVEGKGGWLIGCGVWVVSGAAGIVYGVFRR